MATRKIFRTKDQIRRRKPPTIRPTGEVLSFSGMSALIVDSSTWIRTNLSQVLRELGMPGTRISFASDFDTARVLVEKQAYSLVISELSVGRQDAYEFLSHYRATESGAEGLFIALVGEPTRATLAKVAESSVDSFVLKPFTIDSIKNA
ncbi:MAG: response regulator, partial [Bdellovibrionota bacterium]